MAPLTETIWHRYSRDRSIKTRNQLVSENDGLALEVAHRWKEVCEVPFEDLCQTARIGLIRAVEKFDPALGNAFSSFAVPYIQGEIQHFLRDYSWDLVKVPRRSIEAASRVRKVQRRLIASGRLDLDEGRVAGALGMSAAKWRTTAEAVARKPLVAIEDASWVAAEQEDEGEVLRAELRKGLARLPNPFRSCLVERYFKDLSEEAIAKLHQVEVAQVQVWLEEGLRRLKVSQLRRAS